MPFFFACICPGAIALSFTNSNKHYFWLDCHTNKNRGGGEINNDLYMRNSIKKRLFQAFTAVSGSTSAEEDWTDTIAYWETL